MIRPSTKPLLLVAWALLAAASGLHAQNYKDTILTTGGQRIRGVEVTAMTKTAVTYKKGGNEETIESKMVSSIEWDQVPTRFTEALAQEAEGKFEDAANYFQEAVSKTARTPLKLEMRFRAARAALAGAGAGLDGEKAKSAADALESYIEDAPDGFYARHAQLLIARSLRLQGRASEADAALQAMESTAGSENWGIVWEARIRFERARCLLALGKASDARSAYRRVVTAVDAVLGRNGTDLELLALKTQSLVGEGETYIAENNQDQALTFFRKYTSAPAPGASTVLQAAALAGEAEALFLKASGDSTGLREAQVAMARANLLDTSNGDTTAKALYYSGKILLALGPERERRAKQRARAYFDTVVQYYGGTSWAAKARAEAAK